MIKSDFLERNPKHELIDLSLLKGGKINLEKDVDYYYLLVPVYF